MAGDVMPEAAELGPIGSEILFENEHVRVWSLHLAAGETQDWHRHDLPYVVIPVVPGDQNVMVFADGRERETVETRGGAMWREAGQPHKLENRGMVDYENVLVEIKTSTRA